MTKLQAYIDEVVEPTLAEHEEDATVRRAFLLAVAIYHAVDRAAEDRGLKGRGNLRKAWGRSSAAFKLVDVVAHRFKHVVNPAENETREDQWGAGFTYGHALRNVTASHFAYIAKDAINFLRTTAAEVGPAAKRKTS